MPTPTPLPAPPVAPISIDPGQFRIWNSADEAITIWNGSGNAAPVIQIAIILLIIIVAVFLIMGYIKSISSED